MRIQPFLDSLELQPVTLPACLSYSQRSYSDNREVNALLAVARDEQEMERI